MRRLYLALGFAVLLPLAGARAEEQSADKAAKKADAKPTVAVFRLHGEIPEAPAEEQFSFLSPGKKLALKDLVARMKKAGEDPAVKAVVLLAEESGAGSAQVEELRQAMARLRAAGKDVFVHSDSLSMRDYVLFCGASRLSVVPTADLWVNGVYGEQLFLRGLLDKLGVQPEFLTCGAYKSAAEVFMREGPSRESDEMMNWLFDGLYDTFVKLVAKGRGVDAVKAKAWIDAGPYTAEKAKAAGLVDAVEHRQEFEALLKSKFGNDVVFDRKYGEAKQPALDMSSPFAMFKILGDMMGEAKKKKPAKDAVGIVYVEGGISLGDREVSPFGSGGAKSSAIRKALDEAARDDSIKAVVLRVNSPGGSAVASEIILDATRRVKAKKPFVVSMGDVAGSGGYYVACGADTIFADEATITGSIGVVAGKMVTTPMWKKIGVTFKGYKRGENAALLNSSEPFTKAERDRVQAWMDDIYSVFKGHVTAARGERLKKPLEELAGGRVYTGRQALELGLVDKIGTLQDAVEHIAAQAKLTDYDIRVVPAPKNFIELLLEELSGGKDDPNTVGLDARKVGAAHQPSLVDLALPHIQHLDPQRVRLIKTALQRLQLIQQEGAVLMMPEILVRR